jgi:O-antigen biosynthesis protein
MSVDEHITEQSPERATPEEMAGRLMESEHRGRYLWAAQLGAGETVLDAGCGAGYGTAILADAGARRAVGVDISPEAIEQASTSAGSSSVEFSLGDLQQLPFADATFGLAVCFEAIEHIEGQARAISELRRVLRPDGVLAISSPNRNVYPPGNPHHTHEFTPDELEQALLKEFANVSLYRQSPWLAAAILADAESRAVGSSAELLLRTIKIAPVEPGDEVFTIALASNGDLPAPEALALMGEPFEVRWWEARVSQATAERDQAIAERDRAIGERAHAIGEREELGRAVLDVDTELATAQEQVAELRAEQVETTKWAMEQILTRDDLLRRSEIDRLDYESRLRRAEQTIHDVTGSTSWRLTGPLRMLKRLFPG